MDSAVVVGGGCRIPFAYDGFGRLVRAGCVTSGAGYTYLYDGDDLLMEFDSQGGIRAEYTYYPGVDRPHSLRRSQSADSVFYHLTDFPGSVLGTIDEENQVVSRYRYCPFGSIESGSSEAVRNSLRFMGAHDVVGLYFLRNRWYHPLLERFLSDDPIGLAGDINLYRFTPTGQRMRGIPSGWRRRTMVATRRWRYCRASSEGHLRWPFLASTMAPPPIRPVRSPGWCSAGG